MPTRLVFGTLVVITACSDNTHHDRDGGDILTDGGTDLVVIDAPPDAWELDTTPPSVAAITPAAGAPVWLHAPIRVTFTEPLDASSMMMTVTARIAGTSVPAQLALEAPSTIVVTLAASARGVGTLDVDITGSVADLAGNKVTAPIDLSFAVPAWSSEPIDRGVATGTPDLAVSAGGDVWAAWLVGNGSARRAVVSELTADTWHDAGGPIGSGSVSSVAITLDQDGSTLVGWVETGQAHVARWTGSAWNELASPGAATQIALATPPTGAPLVGLFGATAGVRRLDPSGWQPIGMDIVVPAAIASPPALVAIADGRPAIGWIDTQSLVRVYRYDATWTTIAPLEATPLSRMTLAARGNSLAVAWDQFAGSYSVVAAQAPGIATAWTRLGRALDIDITGNAVAPAIAIDAAGAPIVAWTELVETRQRGALARWTGAAWSIVGGVTWLDAALTRPTPTHIALHAGEAAVVATSNEGRVHIARLNGPRVAAPGIATRASRAGCSFDVANPPALLSQTGCFVLSTPNQPVPHPGLIPFDVISELWSDGSKKRRYIGLPDGAAMSLGGNGSWGAPIGTLIIKQFDLETTPGIASTRRPVETRFLVNTAAGWQGFSFNWNAAGTDATLLPDGAYTFPWRMDDGTQRNHLYPSRGQCQLCHHPSMGPLLGLRSEQLARWFDYNGVIADQLVTLRALGVGPVSSAAPFLSAHEPGETFERRMRGYMAGNCAHCHNPQNIGAIRDMRFTTPLAQSRLCESIVPGSPAGSRIYQLVTSRPGMPSFGTLVVDPLAEQMLNGWITGMTSCP